MRKRYIFIIALILIIISIGCSDNNASNLPTSSVSLRHNQMNDNIHIFEWGVENLSQDVGQTLTFKKGSITNYEIRNLQTNKIYTNKDYQILDFELINKKYTTINNYDNCTVVLNPGEKHHKTIVIQSLEEGRYSVKFWAVSEEGTNPAMTIDLEIKANKKVH